MADRGSFGFAPRLDIQQLLLEAQHRWLRPAEICEILRNHHKFHIASEPPNRHPRVYSATSFTGYVIKSKSLSQRAKNKKALASNSSSISDCILTLYLLLIVSFVASNTIRALSEMAQDF